MEPTVEAGVGAGSDTKPALGLVVQIDEERIQSHLDEVVRSTVKVFRWEFGLKVPLREKLRSRKSASPGPKAARGKSRNG